MSRSKWKGPYIHFKFLKKKILENKLIKVWSRDSVILSTFINYKFLIYNGKIFKNFFITREKIGYKFGEFCTTRAKYHHKNKLKIVTKKKNVKKK
jgi:small subunit ribosomal protein S19